MKSILPLFLLLVSCAHQASKSSQKDLKNFCFNSEGKGRLSFVGQKVIFGYESLFDERNNRLTLHLKLDQGSMNIVTRYNKSLDRAIVSTNIKEKLQNPKDQALIDEFKSWWGEIFKKLLDKNSLPMEETFRTESYQLLYEVGQGKMKLSLLNLDEFGQFNRMTTSYESFLTNRHVSLDLIVRKCFTKP